MKGQKNDEGGTLGYKLRASRNKEERADKCHYVSGIWLPKYRFSYSHLYETLEMKILGVIKFYNGKKGTGEISIHYYR